MAAASFAPNFNPSMRLSTSYPTAETFAYAQYAHDTYLMATKSRPSPYSRSMDYAYRPPNIKMSYGQSAPSSFGYNYDARWILKIDSMLISSKVGWFIRWHLYSLLKLIDSSELWWWLEHFINTSYARKPVPTLKILRTRHLRLSELNKILIVFEWKRSIVTVNILCIRTICFLCDGCTRVHILTIMK